MIAAAPSWHVTIDVCAVFFPIIAFLSVGLLRDVREFGAPAAGEASRQPSQPLPPLVISAGIPVALSTAVLFVSVAQRDHQLEGHEIAVLCGGTGIFLLLIVVDIFRSARRNDRTALQRTDAAPR